MSSVAFNGRPGLSPVVAALVAAGVIPRGTRVLDLGCAEGEDALALAAAGLHVVGYELDRGLVRRARATQRAEARHQPLVRNAEFRVGQLPLALRGEADGSFGAVVDTLFTCNLDDPNALGLVREVARVLRPGGPWIVQYRLDARHDERFEPVRVSDLLPAEIERHFDFPSPLLRTRLAEYGARRRLSHARVAVGVGLRRVHDGRT